MFVTNQLRFSNLRADAVKEEIAQAIQKETKNYEEMVLDKDACT